MYDAISVSANLNKDKEAIVAGSVHLNFGVLLEKVQCCAEVIKAKVPGPVIAFCLPRLEAIVFMLACLKIGKTFIPIDSGTAGDVRTCMMRTAGCAAMVDRLDCNTGEMHLILFDVIEIEDASKLDGVMSFMFTSGSTGKSKGVMVRHASVKNLLHAPDFFKLREKDVFATYSSLSFDASTLEIFTPLINGNKLVILDKMEVLDPVLLQSAIFRDGISVMWMTAGLFNTLVLAERSTGLSQLRTLFVGGDKLNTVAARRFVHQARGTDLYNCYGPTENTIFTTVAAVTPDVLQSDADEVPIGWPVRGVQCVIRNANGGYLKAGEALGRLMVSGEGLAAGYIDHTGQFAFAAHADAVGGRFHDTGDVVRRDAYGCYYFVGRSDSQVKLNGHRVDLMGIEQRCMECGIGDRVQALYSQEIQGLMLVCNARNFDRDSCCFEDERLHGILNAWERPKRIVFVTDWPLTQNGKTDVQALRLRAEGAIAEQMRGINEGDALGNIIAKLTGAPVTNWDANLFDIGFDSISVTRLQVEIEMHFGTRLNTLEIYEAGSLKRLKELINARFFI